jgi:hypothetical protein
MPDGWLADSPHTDAPFSMTITVGIVGISSFSVLGFLGIAYRRFRRTATNDIEPFSRYVSQGVKYYVGRFVRRQLAAELTLRQFARVHLRNTATEMMVPATYPVRLKVDEVFVPLLLRGPTAGTIVYSDLLDRESSRVVIVGEPGSGKSSLMKRTFRDACRKANSDPRRAALPLLFELRRLADLDQDDLADLTQERLFDQCVSSFGDVAAFQAKDAVEHLQHGPGYLVLLDGLDEVPGQASAQVVRAISDLAEHLGRSSPRSSLIVSTRTQHYLSLHDRVFSDTFHAVTVRAFSLADVYKFLLRWPFEAGRREHVTRLFSRIRQLPSLTEMCTNPLALSMFVARDQQTGGAISPETRTEFYRSLVEELLVNRRLRREEDIGGRQRLLKMREQILGVVCLGHLLDPGEAANSVPAARLLNAIQAIGHTAPDAESLLSSLSIDTGLFSMEREGETYRFLHLTLCEFLAAKEMVNLGDAGWRRIAGRLFSRGTDSTTDGAWDARLAEVTAFGCGLAPRVLQIKILAALVAGDAHEILLRAAIEAQSYDNAAVLGAIRNDAERLAAIGPDAWDEAWFSQLRLLISVLRDIGYGARPEFGPSSQANLPGPAGYLVGLIDAHGTEDILLATLARNDADGAVAIAEGSGRPALLEVVASTADDFSVLVAILARCDAGETSWQNALVHCALRQREIADVLAGSTDTAEPRRPSPGWATAFLTGGSVYGRLLDDVLASAEAWWTEDVPLLQSLARIKPPQSFLRTKVRACLSPGRALFLFVAPLLAVIATVTASTLTVNQSRHSGHTGSTALVLTLGAAVAAIMVPILLLTAIRRQRRGRVAAIEVQVSGLSVKLEQGDIGSRKEARSRLNAISSSETDDVTRFWRKPLLEEVLNLGRFRFAPSDTRENGITRWEPGTLRRLTAGVSREDASALILARQLRDGSPKPSR